jgi:hypothetical protein
MWRRTQPLFNIKRDNLLQGAVMLIVTRPDGLRIDHEDMADGYKPKTFDIISRA